MPLIKTSMFKAMRLLNTLNDVVINVSPTDDAFVKDRLEGVAGFTPNRYTISIRINSSSRLWKKAVGGTAVHEFSHAVRFQKTSSRKRRTLLDSLVLEGVAQCFEEDVTGRARPWSKAITSEQARRIWMKIRGMLNKDSSDLRNRMFMKKDDKEFPLWSGYTIGYLIVKKRLAELGKADWNRTTGKESKALVGRGLS